MYGLYSRVACNQERLMMACVRYIDFKFCISAHFIPWTLGGFHVFCINSKQFSGHILNRNGEKYYFLALICLFCLIFSSSLYDRKIWGCGSFAQKSIVFFKKSSLQKAKLAKSNQTKCRFSLQSSIFQFYPTVHCNKLARSSPLWPRLRCWSSLSSRKLIKMQIIVA